MTPGVLSGKLPLTQMKRISPSRFQSLKECALREVWAAACVEPLLPASPYARLGSAIHRLLEEAGKGLLAGADATAIEERWEVLVAGAEAAMRGSWLERHFVPLRTAIADYQVRKLRAIQRANAIAQMSPASPAMAPGQSTGGCELWVATPDGLVGGYIDQVELSDARPVLRDYKTGQILEGASEEAPGAVKECFEVQLKLYAAIYAASTGVWPAKLELIPLHGGAREVKYVRSECEQLLGEAREVLAGINSIIVNNSPATAESLLAAPTPNSCRYCLFRPACSAYRLAREKRAASDNGWPEDLWGNVSEKRVLRNGKILLTVQPTVLGSQCTTLRGLSASPERHPVLPNLATGDLVAVFGLKAAAPGGTLQESSLTVVYRLDAGHS
jgi:RecB family exonuclease